MARVWTTSITGLNGRNEPFPCDFIRLGGVFRNFAGDTWLKAHVFHGLGNNQAISVDAATLFIDRNCSIPVFSRSQNQDAPQ